MARAKILILEDEPSSAEMYAAALKAAGKDVVVYTRFEDARAYLKHEVPDAVLTDIRVGEYNGLQLAIFFRAISPDGTLVVVTGYDDIVLRKEAAQLRATFLLKPVDIGQLTDYFVAAGHHAS